MMALSRMPKQGSSLLLGLLLLLVNSYSLLCVYVSLTTVVGEKLASGRVRSRIAV